MLPRMKHGTDVNKIMLEHHGAHLLSSSTAEVSSKGSRMYSLFQKVWLDNLEYSPGNVAHLDNSQDPVQSTAFNCTAHRFNMMSKTTPAPNPGPILLSDTNGKH